MVWERVLDVESGNPYYYDADSGETQWEFPLALLERALGGIGWARAVSDAGEVYFYNLEGGETSWEMPAGVLEKVKAELGDDVTWEEVGGANSGQAEEEKVEEMIIGDEDMSKRANDILKVEELLSKPTEEVVTSDASLDERKRVFFELLKSAQVDKRWSFSRMIKELAVDARYWALEDPLARQRAFEEYLEMKADEDFKQSSAKSAEYKDKFVKLLGQHEVKYYSQWGTVLRKLVGEEAYEAIPERFRVEFFNEYTQRLREKHDSEIENHRMEEEHKISEYLKDTVEITTKFDQVYATLAQQYPHLSKKQVLEAFTRAVEVKEMEMEAVYASSERQNYRSDRKTREAFKALVQTIPTSSQMKWADFLKKVKTEPAFVDLCGHNGSTPIEYFWDIVDAENVKLRAKRDRVRDSIMGKNLSIDELTLEQFTQLVCDVVEVQDVEVQVLYKEMRSVQTKRPAAPQTNSASKRTKQY